MSKVIMHEIDPVQMDALATDVRNILLNHNTDMESLHIRTLEDVLTMLELWADPRSGMHHTQAYDISRILSPMPDLFPHWSEA